MIRAITSGQYKLIETWGHTKILQLNGKRSYAWIVAKNIGELLVSTFKKHAADYILSAGSYRLYEVTDEPNLIDGMHLELLAGEGLWQGYLLPTGLPTRKKVRNRIIPTKELLTKTVD
ncbi:MAG: hypothetical protein A2958_01455 [Candidatus Levybacteria bacterium RIFCSPLOWO2_01_FULL_38_13]|nr:MAG: hypothetical protein A2629_01615 [Candidatus Levybacteria bacterium RIFCSPHIGHO2_01_FULL_41_15]OGH34615.1 MAG: hypothetical protein A2958_01455 [Candidatus Levybacteria bacterium RIFCSPLOWO2_01_FULL_38_13]